MSLSMSCIVSAINPCNSRRKQIVSKDIVWVDFSTLENFMIDTFKGIGVPEEEARICA